MKKYNTFDKILELAIKNEQEAMAYYIQWSKNITDASLLILINSITEEKRGHLERLSTLKNSQQSSGIREQMTHPVEVKDLSKEIQKVNIKNHVTRLQTAMNIEKTSFKLYTDIANSIENNLLKLLFQTLAKEESKHKLLLEIFCDKAEQSK
jgi:rubrerythrin